jgi:hypothetical protein
MLAGLCLSVAGCFATPPEVAVQRAAREFRCPSEDITVVQRADITDAVYDVSVCGQRARYACIYAGGYQGSPVVVVGTGPVLLALPAGAFDGREDAQCIREPDPPQWDPDPVMIASLPGPPGSAANGQPTGKVRRICGDSRYGDGGYGDCLYRDNGAWRWRPAQSPNCPGTAVGLTCQ